MIVSCLGDSITYGFGVAERNKWINILNITNINLINRGLNGDTLYNMVERVKIAINDNPDSIFVMAGINDLIEGESPKNCYNNTIEILKNIREHEIIPIVGLTMYPDVMSIEEGWTTSYTYHSIVVRLSEYRKSVIEYCKNEGIGIVDLFLEFPKRIEKDYGKYFLDGIHPTAQGHRIMADIIGDYFKHILEKVDNIEK